VNVRAPASADPGRIIDALGAHMVTGVACAPATLERLLPLMTQRSASLPSLRRAVVGGGPVSRALCLRARRALPSARLDAVYGCTEAEPIATATFDAVISARGPGYLVGAPVPCADVIVASLRAVPRFLGPDGMARFAAATGDDGEIVVRGPHVSRRYAGDSGAESRTKARELDGSVWHRTGDVGHVDAHGRLWLTGRIDDLVSHGGAMLHPFVVEAQVGGMPGVRRCALVAARDGSQGICCIETDTLATTTVISAVHRLLADMNLAEVAVRTIAPIPMDARHASKVDRVTLRRRLAGRR
jgi:acyl-coenzyme A synthetase/AMP-(fatty) acid ligase